MVACQFHGPVDVPLGDGLVLNDMSAALAGGVTFDAVVQPSQAVLQREHRLRKEGVAGGVDEFAVEGGVGLDERDSLGHGLRLIEPGPQALQCGGLASLRGEAGRQGFEGLAEVEQLVDLHWAERVDDGPRARHDHDEAVGGESGQRLAHRNSRRLQFGGQIALDQAFPGFDGAGDDALAQAEVSVMAAPSGRGRVTGH